jgi:hypothetical protein
MRTLRIALIAATLVSAGQALNAEAGSRVKDEQRYCRTSDGNGWSIRDVKQAIRCGVKRFHSPGGVRQAFKVASCESSFRPHAHDTPGVGGVFQQKYVYWKERLRKWNPHKGWKLGGSVLNPRSNIVISLRMAKAVGWSPAWSCA